MTTDDANVRYLDPPELAPTPGYTHVVVVTGGRTIYVSGQVALNRSGEVVGEGDLKAQARQVFENLRAALGAAGVLFGRRSVAWRLPAARSARRPLSGAVHRRVPAGAARRSRLARSLKPDTPGIRPGAPSPWRPTRR